MKTQHETDALGLISEIVERYRISSLEPLLTSCRAAAGRDEISVAVVGRFKAGKSSFLNHLLGRSLLPVGVIPVTAVVTEVAYGPVERATVHFLDGRAEVVGVDAIRGFVAEGENPENEKQVRSVTAELPTLERFHGLRFVDMPGLESALAHNTEETLRWLPNVGLALVAVSIDTPLSRHDLELLKSLYRYTPNVSILLTKADLLDEGERAEVLSFIQEQLASAFDDSPRIFPYSVRDGRERFKAEVEERLIGRTLTDFREQRARILDRKLETLLLECRDYLKLALSSAETVESKRDALRSQVIEGETVEEVRTELRLIIRHASARTRTHIASVLKAHRPRLEKQLIEGLAKEFPSWATSLGRALESFERWLRERVAPQMLSVSGVERAKFLEPLEKVRRQAFRIL